MSSKVIVIIAAGALLVLLLGGFIAFAMYVSRSMKRHSPPQPSRALEIARERYARGEISRTEFEQIKKDLC